MTKDGETVHNLTYEYDTLHRLRKVQQNGRGRVVYTYDKNGNRATMRYANGSITTYTYNKANWVTGISAVTGSTVLTNYSYTYYADGNRKSETDSISGTQTTYVYDDLGRLTQESETGGLTVNYTYNAAGNRTQMEVSGTETYTTTYTYDANNRLTQESKTQGSTTSTTLYTYDDNGNLLRKGTIASAELYEYNGFNQLVVLKQGDGGATYGYNASGIRVSKNADDTYTYFLLNGGNVVGECTNDALSAVYLHGVNLVYRDTADGTEYYLHDAHGDIVALTNSAGAVTKRYAYDAFGNEVNPSDSDSNPFRYCGEYFDNEIGTYYLRARYYDPAIGRFTQQDSLLFTTRKLASGYEYADPLSLNLYTYCYNNPVAYLDPSGHMPVLELNALGILYNANLISAQTLSIIVLAQNGKNPFTAFHEIAQLNLAKHLRSRGYIPILEYPVLGVGEMDVYANGMGWEVKPIGRKGGGQLEKYLLAGGFSAGESIPMIMGIPIFGDFYMGLVQSPTEPGVVHYFFYTQDSLKETSKVASSVVKREYLSSSQKETLLVCGAILVLGFAVSEVGGGCGTLKMDSTNQECFNP